MNTNPGKIMAAWYMVYAMGQEVERIDVLWDVDNDVGI
jgi:hypothetical protein